MGFRAGVYFTYYQHCQKPLPYFNSYYYISFSYLDINILFKPMDQPCGWFHGGLGTSRVLGDGDCVGPKGAKAHWVNPLEFFIFY